MDNDIAHTKIYDYVKETNLPNINSLMEDEKLTENQIIRYGVYTAILEQNFYVYIIYNTINALCEKSKIDENSKLKILQALDTLRHFIVLEFAKMLKE